MGPKSSFIVWRKTPSSKRWAALFSKLCCSIMSLVSNKGLVNMNSQWIDTLLRLKGTISSCLGSSMTAIRPSGAMASAMAGQ